MADALFEVRGASIGYGKPLLKGISFRVDGGEFWGIFGPNGAGKTTLIKTLLGVQAPLAGEVWRSEGLRLGYVPQLTVLRDSLPLTVKKILELGALDLKGLPRPEETLERIGLAHLSNRLFSDLSGGQRQLAVVARALHRNPDVLVLDEPASGVDLPTRHTIGHLLQRLHRRGVTILMITHLLAEIGPGVNRFLWLDSHRDLFLCGNREEVLKDPRLKEAYGAAIRVDVVDGQPQIRPCTGEDCKEGAHHG